MDKVLKVARYASQNFLYTEDITLFVLNFSVFSL